MQEPSAFSYFATICRKMNHTLQKVGVAIEKHFGFVSKQVLFGYVQRIALPSTLGK